MFLILLNLALNDWSGRFSRKEFIIVFLLTWVLSMIVSIVSAGVVAVDESLAILTFLMLYSMVIIVIFGSVVRRLHDMDKSGWNALIHLIPFINLIFLCYMLFVPSKEVGETRWG